MRMSDWSSGVCSCDLPGTEIIERDPAAERAHRLDEPARVAQIAYRAAFGDFETQLLRRHRAARQPLAHEREKVGILHRAGGEVDAAQRGVIAPRRVVLQPAQGAIEHVSIQPWAEIEAFHRDRKST